MLHYELTEWRRYKSHALPEAIARTMEKHLRSCDQCIAAFLSTIEDCDIFWAGRIISQDFLVSVMNSIRMEQRLTVLPKAGGKVCKKNIAGSYLIAAILAIFLVHSGFFNSLVFRTPQMVSESVIQKMDEPGWTGRLLDSYFSWIIDRSIGTKRSSDKDE